MCDELNPCEEKIRVASVPFRHSFTTVIREVLVNQYHGVKSATYFVSVIAETQFLPVNLASGQLWKVHGNKTVKKTDDGHYKTNERAYDRQEVF
ncbi:MULTISPECIES: hypothetical protein [Marinobacter]|uniref:hypothetical protein n=1 Tax=Marinobacter TaxID=2742 RepID=UPI001B2E143C|nr:hypothetical protein [Marinobacter sp.]MBO6813097.1 hypothetical protein [Marinobacter sp.]